MTDNSFCSPMDRAVGEKNCPTDVPQESPDFVDEIPSGDDTAAEEKVELVIFTMKDRFFAFRGREVREILPHGPITALPGCPGSLRGIINVRGSIESVINLHALLEMDDEPATCATRFILARSGEVMSGIQVERVLDVVTVAARHIKPVISTLPSAVKKFALGGETFYKENYVIVLSVEKLFADLVP